MKIIKKIAAIMLSVMMVLGMCSVVGAEDGSTGTGKITINKAVKDQTYNIYKILDLESYDDTLNNEHYAYKAVSEWKTFLTGTEIKGKYVDVDSDDYVTWKTGADAAQFAKKALAYAKDTTHPITATSTVKATTTTVEFTKLDSGYYLVDSSVGTLCFLDTMKSGEVTIDEKNVAPTVKKEVQEDSKGNQNDAWGNENTADIGQTVNFKTTITAQAGAQNYVLHDKMDAGLTFKDDVQIRWIKKSDNTTKSLTKGSEYDVTTTNLETTDPKCTFHVTFKQEFCDKLAKEDTIVITYSATLNENATVGTTGNKNKTWLKYGENTNLETTPSETMTKTYEIPVFKYTNTDSTKKALAGVVFELYRDKECTTLKKIEFVKKGTSTEGYECYRIATGSDTSTSTIPQIITSTEGKFKICGLGEDTYYLKEVTAPKGYNKLSAPVKITIGENGTITVNDKSITGTDVEVENKSGSILPSTGGMGTTLFYIFGAILVIGSGVVLITKKRMK